MCVCVEANQVWTNFNSKIYESTEQVLNLPNDPDRVCAVFAIMWCFGKADVCVFVDPTLIDKEVLVDVHNSCVNKQAEGMRWQTETNTQK